MSLVLLIPVLRRPHRVVPTVMSVDKVTPKPYRLLFIVSPSDYPEQKELDKAGAEWIATDEDFEGRGDYARKINLGYQKTTEDLIFLGADDLKFHPNWFEACLEKMKDSKGKSYDVIGTNDLGNKFVLEGTHSTHTLVTRSYVDNYGTIDETGKVLHEGYIHEYVDNEFVETARHRNAWAFAQGSRVEHLHPAWKKAPSDGLYRASPMRMIAGRKLYEQRKGLWSK